MRRAPKKASDQDVSMRIVEDPNEMRELGDAMRRAGKRVGVVPTMGALHDGHLELVRRSRAECEATVATIFVNPAQFGPDEDFARYPRTFESDAARLAECGIDCLFAPHASSMYPEGHSTFVEPPSIAAPFEGQVRPGHFRGVATIVLKLFQIVPADVAYFGQKDYQQTLVVRRMVRDLNVPVAIVVCPTVREPDGLALSSRNRYLSGEERRRAVGLYRALRLGAACVEAGDRDIETTIDAMRSLLRDHAFAPADIDYLAIADPETLAEFAMPERPAMLLVAARLGTTRLIDNWLVP